MLRFNLLYERDAQDNKIIERISTAKIFYFFVNKNLFLYLFITMLPTLDEN